MQAEEESFPNLLKKEEKEPGQTTDQKGHSILLRISVLVFPNHLRNETVKNETTDQILRMEESHLELVPRATEVQVIQKETDQKDLIIQIGGRVQKVRSPEAKGRKELLAIILIENHFLPDHFRDLQKREEKMENLGLNLNRGMKKDPIRIERQNVGLQARIGKKMVKKIKVQDLPFQKRVQVKEDNPYLGFLV